MKKLAVVVAGLAVVFLGLLCSHAHSERRSVFVTTMSGLKQAHLELHHYGGFTNNFRHMTVYSYTNRVTYNGTNFQCEFAVESECFNNRGFLTITTNEIFVWIDKETGVIPLGKGRRFPSGF